MAPIEQYERLASRLRPDARVVVLTGAGVSAASGVPTFRGAGGLWKTFRAEDLATPRAFVRDPALVWEWYDWRRQILSGCLPNPAHHVLASWSLRFPHFTLITQNVDGLHERAATRDTVRLHGSIWEVGCWQGCARSPHRWRDDEAGRGGGPGAPDRTGPHHAPVRTRPQPGEPVRTCPYCGGLLRPGVVWFGEPLPIDAVTRAAEAAAACDIFLSVGTSSLVYPAAGFLEQASASGAFTVEINPELTPASAHVDLAIAAGAEAALPAVEARLGAHPFTLDSERLILTPLLTDRVDAAHALWTDPDVRRYLWDDKVIDRPTAEAVVQASARDFAERRFGLWGLALRHEPNTLLGFCGLRSEGVGAEPELLFGLYPSAWGKGLAAEASRRVLAHAFEALGQPEVIAATDFDNDRSARTLERIGMQFERRADHHGLDTLFYRRIRSGG